MTTGFLSFLLACVVIELTPGPNMAYLTAISCAHGRRAGFSMVAGIATGLLAIGLVAAFGTAAIVLENPGLYHTLRWSGVLYMVWLAWDNYRAAPLPPSTASHFDMRYFRRGLITNVLNPKAMVFYVAVLPTFIDTTRAVLPQSVMLTVVYVAIATGVHGGIAILGDRLHPFWQQPRAQAWSRMFFSVLLLTVAAWLAYATR